MIRITKKFDFETGHALYGYDGKCKNIHGHSYKLFVTVQGTPITDTSNVKYGMVIDFTDLKKIVKEEIVDKFDHATVFNKNTPHLELATLLSERDHDVILVDYQPTTEMMVIDFAEKISKRLPENISLFIKKMEEHKINLDWSICAFGKEEMSCLEKAVSLGGKLRVGFENSLFMPNGEVASDNFMKVDAINKLFKLS